MNDYELVDELLVPYFYDEDYIEAIEEIRTLLSSNAKYRQQWQRIKTVVLEQQLEKGQALELVNYSANQVIEENTDEEAYVWLRKMITNVENAEGLIEPY